MTNSNRFRIAAGTLIGYNILGTLLTWAAHLQKQGTGTANAVTGGTQFTGPLIIVAIAVVALAVTFSDHRRVALTGFFLLALFGAAFAFGEVTELFQHNVGISAGRWDVVLAGSVVGAVMGIATAAIAAAGLLAARRRAGRPVPQQTAN
jgi:Ca2+/H+ antiporter